MNYQHERNFLPVFLLFFQFPPFKTFIFEMCELILIHLTEFLNRSTLIYEFFEKILIPFLNFLNRSSFIFLKFCNRSLKDWKLRRPPFSGKHCLKISLFHYRSEEPTSVKKTIIIALIFSVFQKQTLSSIYFNRLSCSRKKLRKLMIIRCVYMCDPIKTIFFNLFCRFLDPKSLWGPCLFF